MRNEKVMRRRETMMMMTTISPLSIMLLLMLPMFVFCWSTTNWWRLLYLFSLFCHFYHDLGAFDGHKLQAKRYCKNCIKSDHFFIYGHSVVRKNVPILYKQLHILTVWTMCPAFEKPYTVGVIIFSKLRIWISDKWIPM